jgi:hypothetical protein
MGMHIPDLYKRLRTLGDIDAIIADTADLIATYRLDLDTVREVLAKDVLDSVPPLGEGLRAAQAGG